MKPLRHMVLYNKCMLDASYVVPSPTVNFARGHYRFQWPEVLRKSGYNRTLMAPKNEVP